MRGPRLPEIEVKMKQDVQHEPPSLRLECLPADVCEVCGQRMSRGSGGKWICRSCGYMLTCCDP